MIDRIEKEILKLPQAFRIDVIETIADIEKINGEANNTN